MNHSPKLLSITASIALAFAPLGAYAGVIGGPNDHVGHSMPEVLPLLAPPPARGEGYVRVQPSSDMGAPSDIGAWRTTCTVSKMDFVDPIVFPGQYGLSHHHTFVGNTGVNERSTFTSLVSSGNSTCFGGIANRSVYWIPSMINTLTGAPVKPSVFLIYYKQGYYIADSTKIQPVPAGLKMIAGNAKNVLDVWQGGATAWVGSPYTWKCMSTALGYSLKTSQQIEACPTGANQLWLSIAFPQCWDGVNLDSADHKSHMSNTVNGACPADHPVAIPELTYQIEFDLPAGTDTSKWRLSSDMYDDTSPGGRSAHADYMMAWPANDLQPDGNVRSFMETLTKNCIQKRRDCHNNLLGDGRTLY
jgi:hypothetical protein